MYNPASAPVSLSFVPRICPPKHTLTFHQVGQLGATELWSH